ncbi:hypothetical protein Tco_0746157 [Tanacetum coccineum]
MGGSYYPIPCSILSTGKDRKTPQQYPDVPTTSWRIFIRSIDSFQGLTPKSPSSWHRPLAPMFPHDTQYCMEDPKQAFVEYASSRTDEAGVCTLPSDTVKNPKLGTYPVLSARSYPTIDPQCSSHIHSSINAIIIHPKQPEESHDNEPDIGHEAKGSFGNINSNQHPQPDPLASIATEQVRKLNSMLESLGLVP